MSDTRPRENTKTSLDIRAQNDEIDNQLKFIQEKIKERKGRIGILKYQISLTRDVLGYMHLDYWLSWPNPITTPLYSPLSSSSQDIQNMDNRHLAKVRAAKAEKKKLSDEIDQLIKKANSLHERRKRLNDEELHRRIHTSLPERGTP